MLLKRLKYSCRATASKIQSAWMARKQHDFMDDLSLSKAFNRYSDRNKLHAYMHHYYAQLCPTEIKNHRKYFQENNRGFGEDAFHAMWYVLLNEYRPVNCLEIGVYRGQVISLWALISRYLGFYSMIYGISPFTPVGDRVSTYLDNIDYQQDVIKNHEAFNLAHPNLLKAYSTDEMAFSLIGSKEWNLVYIDGSHDYEIALSDYDICKKHLAKGGLLVMDDSSLYTDYRPPLFSFSGHPGPSKIVKEIIMKEMRFLGAIGHNNVFMKVGM